MSAPLQVTAEIRAALSRNGKHDKSAAQTKESDLPRWFRLTRRIAIDHIELFRAVPVDAHERVWVSLHLPGATPEEPQSMVHIAGEVTELGDFAEKNVEDPAKEELAAHKRALIRFVSVSEEHSAQIRAYIIERLGIQL